MHVRSISAARQPTEVMFDNMLRGMAQPVSGQNGSPREHQENDKSFSPACMYRTCPRTHVFGADCAWRQADEAIGATTPDVPS
jgi:hypothetical protein